MLCVRDVLTVVPTYLREPRDLEVTIEMLESLRRTAPDVEVLLIDDGSPADVLVDELEAASLRLESHLHRKTENEGFSKTVNIGLRKALTEGKDAVLVNADIEFINDDWLPAMQAQVRTTGEPAEVVGAMLLYPSGLIQHAGIFFSILSRSFGHIYQYAPDNLPEASFARVCPVTGALQFIRHETLASVGVYDEEFQMGFEDVDYCVRVFKAGGQCVMQPRVRAYHYESLFRGKPSPKIEEWQARSWIYWMQKWKGHNLAEFLPEIF